MRVSNLVTLSLNGVTDEVSCEETLLTIRAVWKMMKALPFAGPCKLPTKESVLKLYYSLRSLDRFSRRSDVPDIVAKLTKQYWIMAKIPAVDDRTVASRVSALVKQYFYQHDNVPYASYNCVI